MVDKFNVSAGGTVAAETVLEAAPVNRGIYGPINFLPGVTNDNESLDLSSSRPTVNGASWIESAVFVDGVDTTFARYGSTRTLLPTTATTEITMEAGGQSADFGRVVGSHINVITKSGTNNWHGEGNIVYEDLTIDRNYGPQPILEQKPPSQARDEDSLAWTDEERENAEEANYETAFGGPIFRDKAWFFVAAASWTTFYTDETDNGDTIDNSTATDSYVAKFNFQPTPKHSLALMGIATPIERLFHLSVMVDKYVPTFHDISGELYSANWNYAVNSKFFLEAKVATQESNEDKLLNPTRGTDIAEALAVKQQDPRFAPVPGLPHRTLQSTTSTTTSTPPPAVAGTTAGCSTTGSAPTSTREARPTSRSPTSRRRTTSSSTGSTGRRPSGSRTSSTTTCTRATPSSPRAPAGSPTATS